jgi:hypothetical protein
MNEDSVGLSWFEGLLFLTGREIMKKETLVGVNSRGCVARVM